MDLLVIGRKIWLYRVATLPIIVLTLLAAFYVVVIKDAEYEATSNYILISPPPPPDAEDIAANPALADINSDNPFTRFSDQSAVSALLVSRLSDESTRQALSANGVDPSYEVAPSSEFSAQTLLLEVTGVGPTPEQAIQGAALVGAGLVKELDTLQESRGVAPRYRIEAQSVTAASSAQRKVSSTLRPLVGVLAFGGILLFVAVSAGEALTTLRSEGGGRVLSRRPRPQPFRGRFVAVRRYFSPLFGGEWAPRTHDHEPNSGQDREGSKEGKPAGPPIQETGHSWRGRRQRRRNGSGGKKKRSSPGYLRNFLVPRKLAQPATKGALEEARMRLERAEEAERRAAERADETAARPVKDPPSKGAASSPQREGRSSYGSNGSNGSERSGKQERDRGADSKA